MIAQQPVDVRRYCGICLTTYNTAEKCSEQCLRGEVVAHFLQTEQYATDWGAERNGHTTCGTGTQYLSPLAVIVAVFRKDTTCDVTDTRRDVYLQQSVKNV